MRAVWGGEAAQAPFLHSDASLDIMHAHEAFLENELRPQFRYNNWARQAIFHRNASPSRYYMGRDGRSVSYPFLDRRLLEFCLRIPPEVIYCEQEGHAGAYSATKTLVRKGLIGTMPSLIRSRTEKTFAHAFLREVIMNHYPTYMNSLAGDHSELAKLGLIDPEQLRAHIRVEIGRAQREETPSPNYAAIDETLRMEIWLREMGVGREAYLKRIGFGSNALLSLNSQPIQSAVRQLSDWLARELPSDAIYPLHSRDEAVKVY